MSHIHIHVHMYERTIQVYTRGCACTIWVYTHMHVIMHMVHAFAHEYAYAYMHFHMHTGKWNAYTHIRVPYGCTRICTPKVHACAPKYAFPYALCMHMRPPPFSARTQIKLFNLYQQKSREAVFRALKARRLVFFSPTPCVPAPPIHVKCLLSCAVLYPVSCRVWVRVWVWVWVWGWSWRRPSFLRPLCVTHTRTCSCHEQLLRAHVRAGATRTCRPLSNRFLFLLSRSISRSLLTLRQKGGERVFSFQKRKKITYHYL